MYYIISVQNNTLISTFCSPLNFNSLLLPHLLVLLPPPFLLCPPSYYRSTLPASLQHRHKAIFLKGLYLTKPEKKPKGAKYCFVLHAPDKRNERKYVNTTCDPRPVYYWVWFYQERDLYYGTKSLITAT